MPNPPIGAPYEAQFHSAPDAPSDMFADSLASMVGHIAQSIQSRDPRYRGYVRVTNHNRTLQFVEVNDLGRLTNLQAKDCPGHVASDDDPKVCRHCGTHVDELRDEGQPS